MGAPPVAIEGRQYLVLLVAAAALGVPAAAGAALITAVLHELQHLAWDEFPAALGASGQPWWLVIALPALAGAIVAAATRLPGGGGHPAIDGFSLDPIPPAHLIGLLIAAAASIVLGPVVGPEAPLLAVGLCAGGVTAGLLRAKGPAVGMLAFAGAFAAISTVFGGPLPAALMLFEFVALSGIVSSAALGRLLLPGLLAAGVGSLVFTGIGNWSGVQAYQLALPNLPAYETVQALDVLQAFGVALVAGVLVVVVMRAGRSLADRVAGRNLTLFLIAGGALVGLLAVIARAISDAPVDLVLFSGSAAMPHYLDEGSIGLIVTVAVAKALALIVTAGVLFRGGLIFPAMALGVLVGVTAHLLLPDFALAPAAIAGIAAGAAASLRAPFFGALAAALLAGAAAPDLAPVAIIAAATAWAVAVTMDADAGGESGGTAEDGGTATTAQPATN